MILDQVDRETRTCSSASGSTRIGSRRCASASPRVSSHLRRTSSGRVEPPADDDVTRLPDPGSDGWAEARQAGVAALESGRIAQVVLAGGMATRFGGVVKGVVEALDGRSFLSWKLGETARLADALGAEIPVALMTSFATADETRAHVDSLDLPELLWFSQFVSLRLTESGNLFLDDGRPSLYAPGHGDLLEAIRRSGTLDALRARGVEHVAVSNVDNLGARLDPVVIGAHLLADRPMTSRSRSRRATWEVLRRVDGRLGLLEGPQFPPDFEQGRIRVFNTNTTTLAVDALDRRFDLQWLYVRKTVGGRTAIQLERLYHQIAWELDTTFLEVPRCGTRGRFFPIKEPADLERSRPRLHEMLSASVLD